MSDTVKVEFQEDALGRPQFIIESDGVYYLTLALWSYDPHADRLDQTQAEDVARMKATFERLEQTDRRRVAVELPVYPRLIVHQHTSPTG